MSKIHGKDLKMLKLKRTIDDGFDKTTILILMPSTLVVTHSQTRLKVGEMLLLDSND